ncbi:single-stranded DNA-binding protein [Streptomyces scabiei]
MSGETVITVVGNLVDAPELRFTPAGVAVAKFRIASTPRRFNKTTNEWEDGDSLFLTCSVWRQAAENVAESLAKGMRVIVQGRLKQRSYEDKEQVKRTVYELDVDEVGPSLTYASAVVTKKTGGGQASQREGSGDPWAGAQPANGQQQGGGWGGAQQQQPAAQGAGPSDEPPF